MLSRRGFLVSGASFAALMRMPSFAAQGRDFKNPDLRVGVISDVHIRNAGDERVLLDVLRWYRNNRVDVVAVAGDVADYGLTWQMDAFMCAWRDVFPDNMIDGGKKVELICVTGNHEYDIWQRIRGTMYKGDAKLEPYVFVKNIEREWERLFGFGYADTFVRDVKGYKFFCSNFIGWNHQVNLAAVQGLFERAGSVSEHLPFLRHFEDTPGYEAFCARLDGLVEEGAGRLVTAITQKLPDAAMAVAEWVPAAFLFVTVMLLACYYFSADDGRLGRGAGS